ncbi:VOC family protein [Curvibacter sp. RS43]|jgi:catechol 2,3-dioxygenase-like lactoylglutathione lyase family enzyme|uniref:VOC family protein n=1 Tax=Curvibacter microcysteis TaxID=3026419 RepID=UPI0023626868|nr:VOC family protein [Curvibacter sp. RS43]MDD0812843.1 VOC family protein [Curvibacter sp. RS43]
MAITGIFSITYATNDLASGIRFHSDLGLQLVQSEQESADFELPDGSRVLLRGLASPDLPPAYGESDCGVREVCWAVDSEASLFKLAGDVARDRELRFNGTTECSFLDDAGLSVRLRVSSLKPIAAEPDPTNAPGRVDRLNQLRRWYERATPQQMQHIVFCAPKPREAARFYVERLGFSISDIQEEGGVFLRAPGNTQHHNLYWQRADEHAFRHVSYGVANVDEIMAGAAFMARQGVTSHLGLGRHRISSTFFYYLPNPCGGDAEYSTDSDCLDEQWQPRVWGRAFGHIWWLAQVRAQEPAPRMRLANAEDLKLA